MDSCDDDNFVSNEELKAQEHLPVLSKERYDKKYGDFKKWVTRNNSPNISQAVLMAFFQELAQKHKPTTLWAYFSMLKTTLRVNDNVDIGTYKNLQAFLKSTASGYSPVRASVFSEKDIQKFMNDAPDEFWLDAKVICIFAVSGACNSYELPRIKLKDVENHGDMLLVRIAKIKTKPERSFTITGTIRNIVQKYIDLRAPFLEEERFFLNFQRGKCTKQVIGKNKIGMMPRKIAKFLQLPNPDSFTGNSFRRTSHSFQKTSAHKWTYACVNAPVGQNFTTDSVQYEKPTDDQISRPAAYSSSTCKAVNETYSSVNTWIEPKTDHLVEPTNDTNPANKKFGEIYCNAMGMLTYHCSLCQAQMDQSDEFSLHYMTHFRDVFPIKQESENDFSYGMVEPIEPISIIKLEEPRIKSEPSYSDDDEMSTEYSFSEIEANTIV